MNSPADYKNRLALRGGGFPVLLLGTAAAITATATNEEIRSRFLKALSNIRIGPYQYRHKAKPKKSVDLAPTNLKLPTKTPNLNVRNGTWAVEVTEEIEVSIQEFFCAYDENYKFDSPSPNFAPRLTARMPIDCEPRYFPIFWRSPGTE